MNTNSHQPQQSAGATGNPHLLNNPSTELVQRALKSRIWNNATLPNGEPSDLSHSVIRETLSQVGYAWCAGFLDGEGCLTLAKVRRKCGNGTNYRVKVHIPQNCPATLQTFRDYVGENCCFRQLTHRATFTRPIYELVYDGIHACNLLHKLRPFLVRKGAEADVIFEFYRVGEPTRHFGRQGVPAAIWHARERCYDALRCLK